MVVALGDARLVGTVVHVEEVRDEERALAGGKAAGLAVHQVAAEGGGSAEIAPDVVLLSLEEEGEVVLVEAAFAHAVGTGHGTRDLVARVELVLGLGEVHVGTGLELQAQPIGEVIGEAGVHQETVTDILVGAVLGIPPRVGTHPVGGAEEEHLAVLVHGVLEVDDVHGNRHGVHLQHVVRVHVGTGDRAVVGLDADVLDLAVEVPLVVLAEGGGAAEHHVVTAEGGAGNLALVEGAGPGSVDAGLAVLLGEGDVLGVGDAGAEEALHVVEGLQRGGGVVPLGHGLAGDLRAPAQRGGVVVLAEGTLSVLVLHGRTGEFGGEGHGAVDRDAQARILAALLGGDEDDAVTGAGAVEGRGGGALQDGHGLDVFRVDVLQAATHVGGRIPEVVVGGAHEVVHRHTVHDDERLVQARQGVVTAEDDTGGSARTIGGTDDFHTGDLTGQRVGEVRLVRVEEGRAADVLDGIAQRLLLAGDAERGDDGFRQELGVGLEGHVDVSAAAHGHVLGLHADEGELEDGVRGASEGVVTVNVGGSAPGGALHDDAGPDDGLAGVVFHRTLDRNVLRIQAQGHEEARQGENKSLFTHYS